ncbi:Zeta toxin [Leishmania donovani]|uniref:Zeta_toxin_putative/Pfam:PF06414 n=1 Tax=Leishmania donovani TaxID=5661 RepID=A0A6J8FRE5_LEIDO|nr:Zeta toxin [Leishmania donovani]VDZ48373.1 Zeta_toxin_putative/Pfam:PF06414 [Leishmania donovani]
MMQSPPPYVPFVEYVLKAIEHPPYMYVAKLAACCTMLFLTRENPELLQELCHKWAIRFAQDRFRLIRHIRKRASYCMNSLDLALHVGRDAKDSSEDTSDDGCAAQSSDDHSDKRDVAAGMSCCDPDKSVEHLLSILNTLVPMYFSWNWHRADYVIQINKEYEVYVREYVLPMCADLAPNEGADDVVHTPWLLPPHTYLEPTERLLSVDTFTSTAAPRPCVDSPRRPSYIASTLVGGTAPNKHGIVSASGTPTAGNAKMDGLNFPSLQQHFTSTSVSKGKPSDAIVATPLPKLSPTFGETLGNDAASTSSPNMMRVSADACNTATRSGFTHIMSPNVMSARAFNAAAVYGLRFLTLSNYRKALQSNTKGLVIVFHAKYSAKSNEVIDMFQKITAKRLLDPMPTIAVVYAVAEPELSSLYKVSWFPTIVYIPPILHRKHCHQHPNPGAYTRTDDAAPLPTLSAPKALAKASAHSAQGPLAKFRCGHSPVVDAGSPALPHNEEEASRRTNGRSGTASQGTTAISGTDDVARSPRNTSMGPRRSTPTRSQGKAYKIVSDLDAASGRHTSASPSSRSDAPSLVVQWTDKRTTASPPTPTEILFSTPVGESARNEFVTTPPQFSSRSSTGANSSIQGGSVEDGVQPLGEDSGGAERDSLEGILDSGDYVIYPLDGVQTVPALVEWISSRGASVPRLRKMKEFFTCIKTIRQEEKFKRYRELHSAVVTLRRLQGIKEDLSVTVSGGNRSTHTHTSSTPFHQQLPDQPLFIFLGGGMAAGKTTAVAALAKSSWWESHKEQSVVVNADEFKLPLECEMSLSEAHTHSTRAAENLLVKAINQGRSIVLDGTMMWKPFVQQVVAMVRDAHLTLFKQGPGYNKKTQIEQYFVAEKARQPALPMPYKIMFLGITVEVETAVPRGFLRKFQTNRGVPISMQLRSFKLFAENFTDYVRMVDETTLFNNNIFVKLEKGELPPVLAECSNTTNGQLVVHDDAAFQQFLRQQQINDDADNVLELYPSTPVAH